MTRHSGANQAWVRMRFLADRLELEVEDHGKGFVKQDGSPGIGLVAMRERAELLGGTLKFVPPAAGGTFVRLSVPKERVEAHAE